MKLDIEKQKLEEAYKTASKKEKELLERLFSREECLPEKRKPSLDDYTTITNYIDACIVTSTPAILTKKLLDDGIPPDIIALMKLETISRALWGRNCQPKPDKNSSSNFHVPYFSLWDTNLIDVKLTHITIIDALNNHAGFTCSSIPCTSSDYISFINPRLWQESPEKAKYFGEQFIDLWFDYLGFNYKRV